MCSVYLRSDFPAEPKTTRTDPRCRMLDTPRLPRAVTAGALLPRTRTIGQTDWVPREVSIVYLARTIEHCPSIYYRSTILNLVSIVTCGKYNLLKLANFVSLLSLNFFLLLQYLNRDAISPKSFSMGPLTPLNNAQH